MGGGSRSPCQSEASPPITLLYREASFCSSATSGTFSSRKSSIRLRQRAMVGSRSGRLKPEATSFSPSFTRYGSSRGEISDEKRRSAASLAGSVVSRS